MMLYVGNIEEWLAPVVGFEEAEGGLPTPVLIALTLTVVAVGVVIGWRQYATRDVPEVAPTQVSALTVAARNDLYGDAVNEAVFMRPGQHLTRTLVWTDNKVVDGAVNGTAAGVGGPQRADAPLADRLCPELRPDDAARRRDRRRRPGPGGSAVSTDLYLVALMALPILGGLLVAVLPKGNPGLAKKVRWASRCWCSPSVLLSAWPTRWALPRRSSCAAHGSGSRPGACSSRSGWTASPWS